MSLDKDELLKAIEQSGSVSEPARLVNNIINGELSNIIDKSSGLSRLKPHRREQFRLILAKPQSLDSISNFNIRCLNCQRMISYPCWHLIIKFNITVLHYFVCFDSKEPNRVNLSCGK